MIYLLLIPLIALIIWGIIGKAKGKLGEGTGEIIITVGSVLTGALLLTILLATLGNGRGLAEWQVFYEANAGNYAVAIDETASYLSIEAYSAKLIDGSIEKFQQSGYVSERVKEWRDSVNLFNTTIASMKYFDQNPFTGILVPDAVQDMKPLMLTK